MPSDEELLRAAGAGERSAWNELVERHSQLVFANARAAGASRTMAEDVSQLVWITLLRRHDTIRDPSRLRSWLAIVARNAARSELRRRRNDRPLDERQLGFLTDGTTPETTAESRSERAGIRVALRALSEKCRELLTLLFSAEMSYTEIAETTGMPIGSIGPTRQRCLESLREMLDRNDHASRVSSADASSSPRGEAHD